MVLGVGAGRVNDGLLGAGGILFLILVAWIYIIKALHNGLFILVYIDHPLIKFYIKKQLHKSAKAFLSLITEAVKIRAILLNVI